MYSYGTGRRIAYPKQSRRCNVCTSQWFRTCVDGDGILRSDRFGHTRNTCRVQRHSKPRRHRRGCYLFQDTDATSKDVGCWYCTFWKSLVLYLESGSLEDEEEDEVV